MKSISKFQESFKGIKSTMNKAAMLAMMTASFAAVMTSCSDKDDVPTSQQASPMAKSIEGEWIMEQENQFALIYHFNNDGTGWKEQAALNDGKVKDFLANRYETEFNYMVSNEDKVIINFTDADGKMTGEKAELLFDGTKLTDKIDDMPVALNRSTEAQINKYKAEADAWHGGSADAKMVDLSKVSAHFTAVDGMTLTGKLGKACKISIADGATITLDNVSIIGKEDYHLVDDPVLMYKEVTNAWSGLTCIGNATIIISGSNTVQGFDHRYPGIFVPENKTLTIRGNGSLTAKNNVDAINPDYNRHYNSAGAGIGAGIENECTKCGNIVIESGNITAIGGGMAAGIGSAYSTDKFTSSCGNITIKGGNITATGGNSAAGIGSGSGEYKDSYCGNILIEGGTVVAKGHGRATGIGCGYNSWCGNIDIKDCDVTADRGEEGEWALFCIGNTIAFTGKKRNKCGTVTIGGKDFTNTKELSGPTFHYTANK